ncbi:hypothetical protein [Janibacter indicus]|nr:hypothetical protein [Janibacter indicus]
MGSGTHDNSGDDTRAKGRRWARMSTGALGLYEHLGMEVVSTFRHLTLPL